MDSKNTSSTKNNVMSSPIDTGMTGDRVSGDIVNPGISVDEVQNAPAAAGDLTSSRKDGSGYDINSDTDRLEDPENLLDKTAEDTFPASDPPSYSPISGIGREQEDLEEDIDERSEDRRENGGANRDAHRSSDLPEDFKENGAKQFEYGRKTQRKTLHFDQTSHRLENGNPDIGDVDLGTIEADRPAQRDDHDHFDSPDDVR